MRINKNMHRIWNRNFILFLLGIVVFFIFMFSFQNNPILNQHKYAGFEIGKTAGKDVYSDRTITYVDEAATKVRIEAEISLIPPVFVIQQDITDQVVNRFEIFSAVFSDKSKQAQNAETMHLEIQAVLPGIFTLREIELIYAGLNLNGSLGVAGEVLKVLMESGVADIPEEFPGQELSRIEIWTWDEDLKSERTEPADNIVTMANIADIIAPILTARGITGADLQAVSALIRALAEENMFYDAAISEESRKQAEDTIEPVYRTLSQNERLIKKGYTVTSIDMQRIDVLNKVSKRENLFAVFSSGVVILIMYLLALLFFNPPIIVKRLDSENYLLLLTIAIVYFALIAVVRRLIHVPDYIPFTVFLPTALASILITILINTRTAVLFTLIISIPAVLFDAHSPIPFLFSFLSGVAGAFIIRRTNKRIDLVLSNFILSGVSALLLAVLGFLQEYTLSMFFIAAGWGALNGFGCGILNIGILPILEHWLNAPTRFRLMELSDINAPMLKKMLTLAPGTYSHSLNVANLAEAACREINANPLLARVGAYYHDIGKIDQPEYFIENQTGDNKHDELKPSLSVAVIKSHVKLGIEKGKDLGLPKKVLDIIAQHHGSGLISYFYSEALKDTKESDKIDPESFSYNESPPASKEAAVVLLADSVEATTRTLKKPTVSKLDKTIWGIIQDKFRNQQLSSSSLTLHDLEVIKNSFVHILAGNFHSRIEYPEINGEQK